MQEKPFGVRSGKRQVKVCGVCLGNAAVGRQEQDCYVLDTDKGSVTKRQSDQSADVTELLGFISCSVGSGSGPVSVSVEP